MSSYFPIFLLALKEPVIVQIKIEYTIRTSTKINMCFLSLSCLLDAGKELYLLFIYFEMIWIKGNNIVKTMVRQQSKKDGGRLFSMEAMCCLHSCLM